MILILFGVFVVLLAITISIVSGLKYWSTQPETAENLFIEMANVESDVKIPSRAVDILVPLGRYSKTGNNQKIGGLIDRVYAVVLENRKKTFSERMKQVNLYDPLYILDALTGDKLDVTHLLQSGMLEITDHFFSKNATDKSEKGRKARNIICCAMGHYINMLTFLLDPDKPEYALFLEDDIEPPPSDFKERFNSALVEAKKANFDIFYFSYTMETSPLEPGDDINKYSEGYKYIWPMHAPYCAGAYILSRQGASKILERAFPMKLAIDMLLIDLIKSKVLRAYGMKRRLFDQDKKHIRSSLGSSTNYRQFRNAHLQNITS